MYWRLRNVYKIDYLFHQVGALQKYTLLVSFFETEYLF